ncbi:MAG: hypothetical protein EOO46_09395 [Flavobacterium sp.]|nr:MAG: hypothetical protein EOO46_09395 [Flavobacterium sp.]
MVTFNRPDTTKQVFEKIKELKPQKLYIYSDAPREGHENDGIKVAETRSIFEEIDWDCDVHRSYQIKNLGCGPGVSHAINWVFQNEEMAIILEDDCVPHLSFFSFCKEMLLKYKDDTRIMHIAGTRWSQEYKLDDCDYFFSRIGHIWGWATWRRAWSNYDFQMSSWNEYRASKKTLQIFNDRRIAKFWDGAFEYVFLQEKKHTWDYQWQFALFANDGLSIVPNVNLISNIGTTGVHASNNASPNLFKKTFRWQNNEKHPSSKLPNLEFERYHMHNHFPVKYPLRKRLTGAIQRLFKQ